MLPSRPPYLPPSAFSRPMLLCMLISIYHGIPIFVGLHNTTAQRRGILSLYPPYWSQRPLSDFKQYGNGRLFWL